MSGALLCAGVRRVDAGRVRHGPSNEGGVCSALAGRCRVAKGRRFTAPPRRSFSPGRANHCQRCADDRRNRPPRDSRGFSVETAGNEHVGKCAMPTPVAGGYGVCTVAKRHENKRKTLCQPCQLGVALHGHNTPRGSLESSNNGIAPDPMVT